MQEEINDLADHENLQSENQYLKMKLMLEKGAEFSSDSIEELDPEIENEFLKHVMAFEEQYEHAEQTTVFEKVGSPDRFLKPELISDEEIKDALNELLEHLYDNGIGLGVCSPNVPSREVYRFVIEELFPFAIDDIKVPGMIQHFIYDEFHEDPVYESSRVATEHCMLGIFDLQNDYWETFISEEQLTLNNESPITKSELIRRVNNFRKSFENIEINRITGISCTVTDSKAKASGVFDISTQTNNQNITYSGGWEIELKQDADSPIWKVISISLNEIPW